MKETLPVLKLYIIFVKILIHTSGFLGNNMDMFAVIRVNSNWL